MKVRRLTLSALFIAVGVLGGTSIYIPIGIAKCYPIQHAVNVMAAIILGPFYSVSIAFCISLLRNFMGTGSLLAFPGSMIGAFFAGILYKKFRKPITAVIGEIFGTGILGSLVSVPIANFIMGKSVGAVAFIIPFLISTTGGSIIGYAIIKVLQSKVKTILNSI
ncbi:energy coupling factor transporter S component ThiW [Clostridium tyrobutyricum]|uniref:energy coupling factor transporter S component ThiW n=1 Tax=Clostridium tyrobutyricum TaxID=1519 RepID=UPI001C38CA9B|nr:energy coupling factor transporter S component ThiW [Clostridium tyrobutyricum]MBV4424826.1 energy coupling factor transporter S component ThiW [Clostridium tyrobutyricum]